VQHATNNKARPDIAEIELPVHRAID